MAHETHGCLLTQASSAILGSVGPGLDPAGLAALEAGAEACQSGYGTTDPYYVGICALQFGDIRGDGTLN